MNWLFRAALWLVPRSWRESVRADLEEENRAAGRRSLTSDAWGAWQVVKLAPRLRLALTGDLLMSDIRYTLRSLLHARWFTIGAVVTFALGIGVNVAVFSAVDHMLFRTLPYADSNQLVQLHVCSEGGRCGGAFPASVFLEARSKLTTVGPMAVAGFTRPFRTPEAKPEEPSLRLHGVSANLLRVVGARPILGRDITDDDERSKAGVCLLSYESWQRRFGGAPEVIGRRLASGPVGLTVIGVLPRGFIPPTATAPDPAWEGFYLDTQLAVNRAGMVIAPVARLKPGASAQTVATEVNALVAALASELQTPRSPRLPRIQVEPLEGALYARFLKYAWLIVAASGLILLMACANLTALLLVRGRSRAQQAAIRIALGASSRRIVCASMLETLVIGIAGSAVALAVFAVFSGSVKALLPPMFARYMAEAGEFRVMGLAILAAVLVSVVAGVWPGWAAIRSNVNVGLAGSETRLGSRVRGGRTVLAIESAIGVVLVLTATLFVGSFAKLAYEDLGFQPDGLFHVRGLISNPRQLTLYEDALATAASVPGIVGVAGSDSAIGGGATAMRSFSKDRAMPGDRYEVNAGYFRAIGTGMVAGREFTGEEVRARAPVAILDTSGAALAFPGVSPSEVVGRSLSLKDELPRTVVGVVPYVRHRYGEKPYPNLYVPLGAEPSAYDDFLVRVAPGTLSPTDLRSRLNQAFQTDKGNVAYVPDLMDPGLRDSRFRAALLGVLAIAGLLLAAGGLYALTGFEVVLRKREIGVRITLGASPGQIRTQIIRDSALPVLAGTSVGLVVAWWTSTVFGSLLYGIEPRTVWAYAVVATLLPMTAILAAWFPARRAARTDPAVVLRGQ